MPGLYRPDHEADKENVRTNADFHLDASPHKREHRIGPVVTITPAETSQPRPGFFLAGEPGRGQQERACYRPPMRASTPPHA
jgi:hypothetical protein